MDLLRAKQICMHPFVIGEIALGSIKDRGAVIGALLDLPQALNATDAEVLGLVEQSSLFGKGIGFTDARLLASALLTAETFLWTRDKRLAKIAEEMGVGCRD